MHAPDLFKHLRSYGVELTVTPDGGLKVTPSSALDDADRQAIRNHKAELITLVRGSQPDRYEPNQCTRAPSRLATGQPEDLALDKAPSHRTSALREARRTHFMRWFHDEGEIERQLDRLDKRDADDDDRRMCMECSHLLDSGRCLAASCGRVPGALRRLEPVRDLLQRCEAFGLRKGLA